MSGDYSRIAFDPWLDDLGVLLEQGRPLTDRDWNDLVLQLNRRTQAGTLDTIGAAVVPLQTPDGFKIDAVGGALTIGRGRMYVDGLLAENHGQAPAGGTLTWDPRLAELFGGDPIDYTAQPYDPNAPALPAGGPHLVYLDVWQREVTRFVRPELVEPALGVDTSTRLQTVWQVKVLPNVGDATCATALDQFPGWLPANAPSAGRLSSTTVPVPGQPDPCQVPPAGGYKGLENQLYRVEIHEGGAPGTATFKWSRDNASVEAVVTAIPSLTQLVVDSVGKDAVLRFSDGDWIEVTDDWLELHNEPGLLRRIKMGGGVIDATRTITLDQPLPAGQFPVDAQNHPAPDRHARIRRWDQKRKVLDATGAEIQDLDAAASDGSITVPAGATEILLEHNIVVSFSVQPAGGLFRSGDYWVFTARSHDFTIDELDAAPPRGIHHHYAKLAIVTFPDTETSCRVFWPPPPAAGGEDHCACTVCVTPQQHTSGSLTVQMAIDQVIARGGGTICLEVGNFTLQAPLQIQNARSLRMVGKGEASRLRGTVSALRIEESQDITLESFAVQCRPPTEAPDAAMVVRSSRAIGMHRLLVRVENDNPTWSAIALAGALVDVAVRESTLGAAIGISSVDAAPAAATGLTDLRIEDNTFDCRNAGVRLSGVTVHQLVSCIRGNRLTGCQQAGIILMGAAAPGFGVEVASNVIAVTGDGVICGLDGLRLLDNDIQQAETAQTQNGVTLIPGAAGANDAGMESVQIIGNHIRGFRGVAIQARVQRVQGMMIKQNRIERGGQGIVFEGPQALDQLAIENNQVSELAGFAIRAQGPTAQVATTANQIDARGNDPAVLLLFERGDNVFSHNQVSRRGGDSPTVTLGGDTLIVASNRVVGTGAVSLDLRAQDRRFTVLGNIVRGDIRVNNAALPAPWPPLNRENI